MYKFDLSTIILYNLMREKINNHFWNWILYEPVEGSWTVLKLFSDNPNLPRTVLPRSFSLPKQKRTNKSREKQCINYVVGRFRAGQLIGR